MFDPVPFSYTDSFGTTIERTGKHATGAPALGLTVTFPIADNLFLLGSFSGFYAFDAGEDVKIKISGVEETKRTKYKDWGTNSTLSMAYYIPSVSTVISLGGRFQYIETKCVDDNFPKEISKTKYSIYGMTLTATYSFGL